MSSERRKAHRFDVQLRARLWSELLELDTVVELEGQVTDLSWGGLFVRSEFLETPGTPVSLVVMMQQQEVPLRGHVAWVAEGPPKGPGMGIRLIAHDALSEGRLRGVVGAPDSP